MLHLPSFYERMDNSVLVPLAPRIAKDLGPFLLITSEDTLSLVLDTLENVVQAGEGKWMDADLAVALTQAFLEVWAKNNKGSCTISHVERNIHPHIIRPPLHIYTHRYPNISCLCS